MNRPTGGDVNFLCTQLFTGLEVVGVADPQLVQTIFTHGFLNTGHEVIGVKNHFTTSGTRQRCVDSTTGQCAETMLFHEIDGFFLSIGGMQRMTGENICPEIFGIRDDFQNTVKERAGQNTGVGRCQIRFVRKLTHNPGQEENAQGGFTRTRGHGDRQQVQLVINQILHGIHDFF